MANPIDPSEQTGKARAQRIPLDYYRHRGRLERARRWAAVSALVLAALYTLWIVLAPDGVSHVSTGRLSAAHAALEQQCSACHVDFVPIAADAWKPQPDAAIRATADRCLACHGNIGAHSESLNAAGVRIDQHCAVCHAEHRGRDHQLVPTADRTCTQCHAQSDDFYRAADDQDGRPPRDVVDFTPAGHGDFASLIDQGSQRPERVRFDHATHLMPGQVAEGQRGGMRLGQLAPQHRRRYAGDGQDDEALVQLSCTDCHQFASTAAGRQRSGDLAWGRNTLPVRYDEHCAACHPLSFPGQEEGQWGVPHAVPMQTLRESVQARLANLDAADSAPAARQSPLPPPRIPGSRSARSDEDPRAAERARQRPGVLSARVRNAIGLIQDQCRKCHGGADLEQLDSASLVASPRLRSGRFDHAAHRQMACVACHPQADPQGQTLAASDRQAWSTWLDAVDAPAAAEDAMPMTLGVASCAACHRQASTPSPLGSGGEFAGVSALFGGLPDVAPSRCVTCHRYHDDPPAVSPASAAGDDWLSLAAGRKRAGPHDRLPAAAGGDFGIGQPWPVGPTDGAQRPGMLTLASQVVADARPRGDVPPPASASCAASTCHGGPIRQQPDWNSSQTVFDGYDPHRRAGWTLHSDWSYRIVTALDPQAAASAERFEQVVQRRCSGCHAPEETATARSTAALDHDHARERPQVRETRDAREAEEAREARTVDGSARLSPLHASFGGDGVSCSTCHGQSEGWLEAHLRADWVASGSMRPTRPYVDRITGCLRCHVGSRRQDGMVRDMNHDMIAAGHPVLRFDPWSALQRLPAHGRWDRSHDGLPEVEGEAALRRYLLGRLVALRAAIELTSERLDDFYNRPDSGAVWPDLSDFDCFACHHRLRITNFAVRPSGGHPRPYAWQQLSLVDEVLPELSADGASQLSAQLESFRGLQARADEVDLAARRAIGVLDRMIERLSDAPAIPEPLLRWQGPPREPAQRWQHWYRAADWYLSAHARLADDLRGLDHQQATVALQRLGDPLGFRPAEDRPGVVVDSPEDFDFEAFLDAARALLTQWSR